MKLIEQVWVGVVLAVIGAAFLADTYKSRGPAPPVYVQPEQAQTVGEQEACRLKAGRDLLQARRAVLRLARLNAREGNSHQMVLDSARDFLMDAAEHFRRGEYNAVVAGAFLTECLVAVDERDERDEKAQRARSDEAGR